MPRPPATKPWFHKDSGYWCVFRKGQRVRLDRDEAEAQRKLDLLLSQPAESVDPAVRGWSRAPFCELADHFLADVAALRSAGTYTDYSDCLARAFEHLDPRVTCGEFQYQHLRKVQQQLAGAQLGPTTICKTLHAVMRVFNWAVEMKYLTASPLTGYQRPAPQERTRIVSDAEFQSMLRHTEATFRRFLMALRLTGCRPGEVRRLVWDWVDLEAGVWVLPEHKTLTRQKKPRPRIVALTPPLLALSRWLLARRQPGQTHVFLNSRGQAWSKTAVVSRLRRLRARAGIAPKAGQAITLYCLRHAYCTQAIGQASDLEVAELVGHTTTRTLKRYFHADTERLKRIAQRAGRRRASEDA
jgi:integrase